MSKVPYLISFSDFTKGYEDEQSAKQWLKQIKENRGEGQRMSDYISKSALIESWCEQNCGERRCRDNWDKCMFVLHTQNQPTLDEKEIIRKPFERVVERLEELKVNAFNDESVIISDAIEIVKEECGINE